MIRILSFVFLAFATQAMATPPRITTSQDRLIAATQTHIYVQRDIIDNVGSHYAALHDQHLVEISIDTGEATRHWPLRHMSISHLETDEFLMPGHIVERDGPIDNATLILQEVGAEPLNPTIWAVDGMTLLNGALMRGEEQLLTPFGIRAAGRAQLAILRDTYPPIETEEEYYAAERIDFYDLYAEGEWDCTMGPEGETLFRANDRILIVNLQCEDFNLSGAWSFHAIISENNEN